MNNSQKQIKTIDQYIATYPNDIQEKLEQVRSLIQQTAPYATEAMAYGIPTFKLNGKNLVHFAAYKEHIGFYPTPSGLEKFENELAPYRSGKGTAKFPLAEEIPFSLIQKITRFRIKEISK